MKSSLAEDSHSAFVFSCSNGKSRTTTAMVLAVLSLWHFNVGHDLNVAARFALSSVRVWPVMRPVLNLLIVSLKTAGLSGVCR